MLLYDVLGDNDPKTLLDLSQNELITWASWKGLTYTAHGCAGFFGCLDTDGWCFSQTGSKRFSKSDVWWCMSMYILVVAHVSKNMRATVPLPWHNRHGSSKRLRPSEVLQSGYGGCTAPQRWDGSWVAWRPEKISDPMGPMMIIIWSHYKSDPTIWSPWLSMKDDERTTYSEPVPLCPMVVCPIIPDNCDQNYYNPIIPLFLVKSTDFSHVKSQSPHVSATKSWLEPGLAEGDLWEGRGPHPGPLKLGRTARCRPLAGALDQRPCGVWEAWDVDVLHLCNMYLICM